MPRPIADRPYPFAPVQRLMDLYGVSDSELGIWTGAQNLRAARRKVQRWKVAGLTESQADQVATRMHMHPAEIWCDYWWVLAPMTQTEDEDSDIEGACDEQGTGPPADPEPHALGERAP
jgi:uncharacterized protein (DUF2267 family)